MANLLWPGESSNSRASENEYLRNSLPDKEAGGWHFSRKEVEEKSPSREHGISFKKETYLRKSYCTFLQTLGMMLRL